MIEPATATRLLESIAAEQLFILFGAGLSMAPPSSLPSAAAVARTCRDRYRTTLGSDLDPALGDVESIAQHFFAGGTFDGLFIGKLVPWDSFKNARPNVGHEAVADFLACKAIAAGVTTNFDMLCEGAAERIGEPDFRPIVDAADIPMPAEHGALLKVHGCASRLRTETIWCREQLQRSPTRERMQRFASWLAEKLCGRDLLVIGFWSDWAYLTELFAANLTSVGPRSVYVVNPDSDADLRQKAPQLWAWANGPGVGFQHIRLSGEAFLDELRRLWSARFVAQLMDAARPAYEAFFGPPPGAAPDLSGETSQTLYALRRDLTGTPSTHPVRDRTPAAADHVAAAVHRRLIDRGATLGAHMYEVNGRRLRVISGRGRLLSEIRAGHMAEPPLLSRVDQVVCAGATEDPFAPHIVRGAEVGSIVRPGSSAEWVAHSSLVASLGRPHQ